jgi:hypothetical protein
MACIHNINTSGRLRRVRVAAVLYGVALLTAVLLVNSSLAVGFRMLAFVPFFAAGMMLFQGVHQTCGMRALRGERETETGVEPVLSQGQRVADRSKARAVFRDAAVTALLATVALLAIPHH